MDLRGRVVIRQLVLNVGVNPNSTRRPVRHRKLSWHSLPVDLPLALLALVPMAQLLPITPQSTFRASHAVFLLIGNPY